MNRTFKQRLALAYLLWRGAKRVHEKTHLRGWRRALSAWRDAKTLGN